MSTKTLRVLLEDVHQVRVLLLLSLKKRLNRRRKVHIKEVSKFLREEHNVKHPMLAIVFGGDQEMMEHFNFETNYIEGTFRKGHRRR